VTRNPGASSGWIASGDSDQPSVSSLTGVDPGIEIAAVNRIVPMCEGLLASSPGNSSNSIDQRPSAVSMRCRLHPRASSVARSACQRISAFSIPARSGATIIRFGTARPAMRSFGIDVQ
jgi:hypothetical protein